MSTPPGGYGPGIGHDVLNKAAPQVDRSGEFGRRHLEYEMMLATPEEAGLEAAGALISRAGGIFLRSSRAGYRLHGILPHAGQLRPFADGALVELREATQISIATLAMRKCLGWERRAAMRTDPATSAVSCRRQMRYSAGEEFPSSHFEIAMDHSSPDPVRSILNELRSDQRRFQRTEGYTRLLAVLEQGCSPRALIELLREHNSFAGDLLWTVCELENVEPYADEAALHLHSPDPGTAGYALEVLLRGARDSRQLDVALRFLESAPLPVVEHGTIVLASQGLERARDVFRLGHWSWAADQVEELLRGSLDIGKLVETTAALVGDSRPDRLFLGLVLAVICSEHDERAVLVLEQSGLDRFGSISSQLRRMFEHRWLGPG